MFGPALVVMGLAGELWLVYENSPFNPNRPSPVSVKHFKIERASVVLVAFGVAIELVAVPHSLMEVAQLKRANLELGTKLVALEGKMQPRKITNEQRDNFVSFLKSAPKKGIWIVCSNPTDETEHFAFDVRQVLDDAGYGNPLGLPYKGASGTSTGSIFNGLGLKIDNPTKSTIIIVCSRLDAERHEVPGYVDALANAFNSVKVKTTGVASDMVAPGTAFIFVAGKEGF